MLPGINRHFSFDLLSSYFVLIMHCPTDRSGETVQTKLRQILKEQSDQGLHCLIFHLRHLEALLHGLV